MAMQACQIGPKGATPIAWDRLTRPVLEQGGML